MKKRIIAIIMTLILGAFLLCSCGDMGMTGTKPNGTKTPATPDRTPSKTPDETPDTARPLPTPDDTEDMTAIPTPDTVLPTPDTIIPTPDTIIPTPDDNTAPSYYTPNS